MSQVNTNSIYDASGGSNAVLYGVAAPANSMGFRNRIINGDMRIDQRNAGAAVTVNSGSDFYAVDRWASSGESADGVFTVQRSTVVPAGFTNSLICTVTTADASIGATQRYFVEQKIEGFNFADLGFGSATAQSVTISFWVRSSVTGTFGGTLASPAGTRYYPFSYTISAANTWEQKSVTIAGDTTGTWATGNTTGAEVLFSLGCGSSRKGTANTWAASVFLAPTGSVDLISTNGATFYITGVQLEAGSVASPFERRDYGRELIMCQRYAYVNRVLSGSFNGFGLSGFFENTTTAIIPIRHPVEMRTSPTYSFSAANTFYTQTTSNITPSAIALSNSTTFGGVLSATVSGATAGAGLHLIRNNNNGSETTITASAEL